MSNGWLTCHSAVLRRLDELLELPDGPVQQHLRGAVRAAERTRDLAVVHPEREAHDQRLAAIVGQLLHALQDSLEVVAILHQRLGRVRGRQRVRVVDRRLRAPRAVAVVVRREVVGDADQPRPQRAPLRLALRALEVPVGLQERLLREVLGVVVVAHPVVRVGVDVAQVRLVERGEVVVEAAASAPRPPLRVGRHAPDPTPCVAQAALALPRRPAGLGAVSEAAQRSGSTRPSIIPASPRSTGASTPESRTRCGEQRHAVDGLGGLPEGRADVAGRHALRQQLAGAAVARARGEHGGHEVARAGEAGEGLGVRAGAARVGVDLGEHLAGGGAGGVRPGGRGGGRGERGGVLRAARELDADEVGGGGDVQAGGARARRPTWREKAGLAVASTSEAPPSSAARGVGGAADRADGPAPARARRRRRSGACRAAARGPWRTRARRCAARSGRRGRRPPRAGGRTGRRRRRGRGARAPARRRAGR